MDTLIGYFHTTGTAPAHRKVSGFCRAAREKGWSVVRFDAQNIAHVRRELSYWRPNGCVIDATTMTAKDLAPFRGLPTVLIDCDRNAIPRGVSCLYRDPEMLVAAAREEMSRHSLNSYGFVSWPGDPAWSRERGDAFVAQLGALGLSASRFQLASGCPSRKAFANRLGAWLRKLEKPAGVLTASDAISKQVLDTAKAEGIDIPSQLVIVGVDDDEFFCEYARPTLSSVTTDFEGAGSRAADILEQLMASPRQKPVCESMRLARTVVRTSSRRSVKHDPAVRWALDFIRGHATEGITADEVLRAFPCSRRLAEQRFRAYTGHSVLFEIHAVQIERAKALIANPRQKLTSIPALCGHQAAPYFQKLFLRHVGMTMSAYRSEGAAKS